MIDSTTTRLARNLHILSSLTRRLLEDGLLEETSRGSASFTQISILKWLDAATPRRAQDVARFLAASAPAATQILNRLRKKGLIRSRQNQKDRRAEDLFVTPKARDLVRRYEAEKRRKLDPLLRSLPPEKRDGLLQGLESAIDLLLTERPGLPDLCLHCGVYSSPGCVMKQHGHRCPTDRVGGPVCGTPVVFRAVRS